MLCRVLPQLLRKDLGHGLFQMEVVVTCTHRREDMAPRRLNALRIVLVYLHEMPPQVEIAKGVTHPDGIVEGALQVLT